VSASSFLALRPKHRIKTSYVRLVAVDQTPLSSLALRTVLARLVPPTCRLKREVPSGTKECGLILRPQSGRATCFGQRGCAWSCGWGRKPPPQRAPNLVYTTNNYPKAGQSRLRRVPPFARRIPYGNAPPKARLLPMSGTESSSHWKKAVSRHAMAPRFGRRSGNLFSGYWPTACCATNDSTTATIFS